MLRVRAPAKLNLYLRVLGKRPDGYHEIETVFERIDLADELTFEAQTDQLRLTCTCPEEELSCGEDNLVLKAACLLQQETATALGARIHLTKRIPVAAGLGGGSSDAAAALVGLNRLWQLGRSPSELLRLAAALGSDVPFFLQETAFAVGLGRGERCESLPVAVELAHVLVVPPASFSTREVYQSAQFDLTASKPSRTMVVHALSNGSLGELARGLWNDLEPEAIRRCPLIASILLQLKELGCLATRLSGSGPAVFGLCTDRSHARQVAARLQEHAPPTWRIEIIQTLHHSPVSPVDE